MIDFSNVSITSDFGDYTRFPELQSAEIKRLEENREFYLVDLRMLGTGELYTDSGDLMLVGGVTNLAQAITHRLMTEKGTHPMDATLGVPWSSFLGQTYVDADLVLYELMQEVTEEIYKDIRVKEITSIKAEFIDINVISLSITISPTGTGNTFNVSLDVSGTGD